MVQLPLRIVGHERGLPAKCVLLREENPEDPDVVRKTAFGQRYTWYIPDHQFRKKNGQQVRLWLCFSWRCTPISTKYFEKPPSSAISGCFASNTACLSYHFL